MLQTSRSTAAGKLDGCICCLHLLYTHRRPKLRQYPHNSTLPTHPTPPDRHPADPRQPRQRGGGEQAAGGQGAGGGGAGEPKPAADGGPLPAGGCLEDVCVHLALCCLVIMCMNVADLYYHLVPPQIFRPFAQAILPPAMQALAPLHCIKQLMRHQARKIRWILQAARSAVPGGQRALQTAFTALYIDRTLV